MSDTEQKTEVINVITALVTAIYAVISLIHKIKGK